MTLQFPTLAFDQLEGLTLGETIERYLDATMPCRCGDRACPGRRYEANQLGMMLVALGHARGGAE